MNYNSDDVELVMYQADEYEGDPETKIGKELDTVSSSLWLRTDGREFPLYTHSEYGLWADPDPEFSENVTEESVSEAFIEGVALLPDGDHNGFTGIDEDTWEKMNSFEQLLTHLIRQALVEGNPRDEVQLKILAICQDKHEAE